MKCKHCEHCLKERDKYLCKIIIRKIFLRQFKGNAIIQPEDECKLGIGKVV